MSDRAQSRPSPVSFSEAFLYWLKLGFISFGGPTGQIAIMHQDLVERKRWISEKRFLHALNYCMVLPGPEAQQLATYIGWMMRSEEHTSELQSRENLVCRLLLEKKKKKKKNKQSSKIRIRRKI